MKLIAKAGKFFILLSTLLGIVFMLLPFYTAEVSVLGTKTTMTVSGFAYAFGGQAKIGDNGVAVELNGAILAIFIIGLVAALLCVALFAKLSRNVRGMIALFIAILTIVAGVLCFLTLSFVEGGFSVDIGQASAKDGLGVGAVLSGILYIIAGLFGLVTTVSTVKK